MRIGNRERAGADRDVDRARRNALGCSKKAATGASDRVAASRAVGHLHGQLPAPSYFAERMAPADTRVVFPVPRGIDPAFWKPSADAVREFQSGKLDPSERCRLRTMDTLRDASPGANRGHGRRMSRRLPSDRAKRPPSARSRRTARSLGPRLHDMARPSARGLSGGSHSRRTDRANAGSEGRRLRRVRDARTRSSRPRPTAASRGQGIGRRSRSSRLIPSISTSPRHTASRSKACISSPTRT